jgi:hypothetical protein
MTRDLTRLQFVAALRRHGMEPVAFGYVAVTSKSEGCCELDVYAPNAGPRRRAQLAYLLRERDRYLASVAQERRKG